ncbi:hypothetical protein NDU88_005167 [Pleurodeles waltl]|uniref:Uncharacterized protein n=1 Tax=Pleurodeles waltl TaxID=8319 RepID=A0AAV7SL00_PLEWA|nr:hypothetical protein NDU88_005167 [Pleurodeles waltl]
MSMALWPSSNALIVANVFMGMYFQSREVNTILFTQSSCETPASVQTTLDRVSGVSGSQGSDTARDSSPAPGSPSTVCSSDLASSHGLTSCPLPPGSQEPLVPSGRSRSLGPGSRGTSCGSPRRRVLLVGRLGASALPWRALQPLLAGGGVCGRAPGSDSALPVFNPTAPTIIVDMSKRALQMSERKLNGKSFMLTYLS